VPFCHLTFSAGREPERRYERKKVPEGTLGAAFRARRWARGLDQREAAEEIGVSKATYCNWEVNRSQPEVRLIPAAIRFLGFDWRPEGQTLGERIWCARTATGASIRELAVTLRVDPTTLRRWEARLSNVSEKSAAAIRDWLNSTSGAPVG
jgi:transcriptional regulator with XRE-family HTH domain